LIWFKAGFYTIQISTGTLNSPVPYDTMHLCVMFCEGISEAWLCQASSWQAQTSWQISWR